MARPPSITGKDARRRRQRRLDTALLFGTVCLVAATIAMLMSGSGIVLS